MKLNRFFLLFVFLHFLSTVVAQNATERFLTPADSLQKSRRNAVVITEAVASAGVLVGLNQLWYADYPRSDFHFIDDNSEWLQMDKAGHLFSSYYLGSIGKNALQWGGVKRKNQLLYGATLGFVFLTAVEVMDGYSSNWGASWGDVAANATGTTLFISQELLWKEQRVVPKFSFHTTKYAAMRPEVLGSSLNEQILKDYNGQTYWLSFNLHSFFKGSKIPKWCNVAIGYGADGMITGNENESDISLPKIERSRQFYVSFDADLTKIETKSHLLKSFFYIFNSIKIPAPTFEISSSGSFKFRYLYF